MSPASMNISYDSGVKHTHVWQYGLQPHGVERGHELIWSAERKINMHDQFSVQHSSEGCIEL